MNIQTRALQTTAAHDEAAAGPLAAKLDEAAALLATCMTSGSSVRARFEALRQRLASGRLQLAVLGQFKRGKSTFINALLGASVLPTAVVPLTAIATFIAWGARPMVRVHFNDNRAPEVCTAEQPEAIRDFLFRFVAEEGNPKNRLGVERVELFYPAPILAGGMVFVDTPGIGSTLRHNTETALRLLPECDAALFVVSADPPITDMELDYLRSVKARAAHIFVIINKIDYLVPDEQSRLVEFLSRILRENSILDVPTSAIFRVSARSGLNAKLAGDAGELERSGIEAIAEHLVRHLATEKTQLLEGAIRTKAADILAQASSDLELRIRGLTLPITDLASKLHAFEETLASIEEQRLTVRDHLSGDQRRLKDQVETRIQQLRKYLSARFADVIDSHMSDRGSTVAEDTIRDALSAAIEEEFERARNNTAGAVSADSIAVVTAHQQRIDALIDTIRRTTARVFDVPLRERVEQFTFELAQEPYWMTESLRLRLLPDTSRMIDRVLPAKLRRARRRARIFDQAEELILRNAENLRWALLRGLDETFRGAIANLEERLDDAVKATKGVIAEAIAQRNDRSFKVEPEVARLRHAAVSLDALRAHLAAEPASRRPCQLMKRN
jgi:GTP-binding protein EngB required for normal cell division